VRKEEHSGGRSSKIVPQITPSITKTKTPGAIDLPIARVYAFVSLLQTEHTPMDNRTANNEQFNNRSNDCFVCYEDVKSSAAVVHFAVSKSDCRLNFSCII